MFYLPFSEVAPDKKAKISNCLTQFEVSNNQKKQSMPIFARPGKARNPSLPPLLSRKIYKTGTTRGADDDEIYQNRVSRSSTVLIPYDYFQQLQLPFGQVYEQGFMVLISPDAYFSNPYINAVLAKSNLYLGINTVVSYETRTQWINNNPDLLGWSPATQRNSPCGGQYVARISATTSLNGEKIFRGFTSSNPKGAGIRPYEYASSKTSDDCRLQLEALFWLCYDSVYVAQQNGMTLLDAEIRKNNNFIECEKIGLLNFSVLKKARLINENRLTVCPLCLLELSGQGFFNRMEQAEGRAVLDLTITQINLFHIEELRFGKWNHRPYNLGWGHHHCNVVVKDSGITETVEWMQGVIHRNISSGYFTNSNSEI